MGFSTIAQYLDHPLFLIGFCLALLFGIFAALIRAGLFASLSKYQSIAVINQIVKYGFAAAIVVIVLGFAYAVYITGKDETRQNESTTQQAGDCGSNIVGNNNTATIECDKDKTRRSK
jgi:hypothetical protein